MRALRSLVAVVIATAMLTGCGPIGFACTAIGHSSIARITLADPRPGLSLELCDGGECTPGPVERPVEVGATEQPPQTGVTGLDGDSVSGWTASFLGGQPVLGYRLTDAAGTVVSEGSVDVEWVRIDGTERCGGNTEADVVLPG